MSGAYLSYELKMNETKKDAPLIKKSAFNCLPSLKTRLSGKVLTKKIACRENYENDGKKVASKKKREGSDRTFS